ncbi:MAG: hypothetical protein IPL34_20135 [Thiofilum sp.]|uniref:hypothetical protein n=1 Tax=Thiofilum sp. TaxID=2212733 RepID=UPI0025E1F857|nr:hypothetical protein [Thiofilum sp.]MBK8455591.1 hypothetical protein [Thiofilum sp.]
MHEGMMFYSCEYCRETFSKSEDLDAHVVSSPCRDCAGSVSTKTNPHDIVMGTLTKREFIAAMVMQGYASRDHNKGRMICDYTYASKEAVERADELIEELNK